MAILRLTTEGPNQRARLAVVCTWEPVEITWGQARPKACVLLSISKNWRRMSYFLPGPVVSFANICGTSDQGDLRINFRFCLLPSVIS